MGCYRILEYLALSPKAENLWKMLKYNDYNALSKDNLSFAEKMNLVWKTGKQEQYSVFFTNQIDDGIAEAKCLSTFPKNTIRAIQQNTSNANRLSIIYKY